MSISITLCSLTFNLFCKIVEVKPTPAKYSIMLYSLSKQFSNNQSVAKHLAETKSFLEVIKCR